MLTTEHILTNSDHWLKNVTNSNCSSKNICLTLAIKASEFVNTHKILSFKAKINIFTACKLSFVLYSQLTVHDNCVQGLYFLFNSPTFFKDLKIQHADGQTTGYSSPQTNRWHHRDYVYVLYINIGIPGLTAPSCQCVGAIQSFADPCSLAVPCHKAVSNRHIGYSCS